MCEIDWSALGTWAAVVVALALGLRDVLEKRSLRIASERLAIASIATPLAEASAAVQKAKEPMAAALEDDADRETVLIAWTKMVEALKGVSVILEATHDVRAVLPARVASAIALVHGLSAGMHKIVSGLNIIPLDWSAESKARESVLEMLGNMQYLLGKVDADLVTAMNECRPIVMEIRADLTQVAKQRDAGIVD